MKSIGILTFHASHNYGSMLQVYALQTYLSRIGHKVEVINLRTKIQRYRLYPYPLEKSFLNIIKLGLRPRQLYDSCKKWNHFEDFMAKNLRLSEGTYSCWSEIVEHINKYDIVITGGDQIWNQECTDFDESYYLPSKLEGVKKVSYSPSFGNLLSSISYEQSQYIKEHLNDYNAISVREFSMKEYLENLLHKNIEVTVDPTLLLTADDYNVMISSTPIKKGRYIFYYSPQSRPEFEELAVLLGKQKGMDVVTTYPPKFQKGKMVTINDAGPSEFLNLLKNATLVVGRSFHLVVFSLLYHKDFIAAGGKDDARINSLLNYLGIPERGGVTINNYKEYLLPAIDFSQLSKDIYHLTSSSKDFLSKYTERLDA